MFKNKIIKVLAAVLIITCGVSAQDVSWFGENPSAVEFRISTEAQLQGLAKLVNDGTTTFEGKTIILENDITLTKNHTPIGNDSREFLGTFDGNEYSISNLSVSGDYKYAGLFGSIGANGQIKNIIVNVVNVNNADDSEITYFGGLAGYYDSGKPVEKCGVNISGHVSKSLSGGLLGSVGSQITISNSFSTGNISSFYSENYYWGTPSSSGGLVGYAFSEITINNSYSTGNISSTIYNSTNNSAYSGGLVGYCRSQVTINNSYSTGYISANSTSTESYSGGLVGCGNVIINKSYTTGNVFAATSSNSYSGGLAGNVSYSATISNSYSTGNISAIARNSYAAYSGGLIGYAQDGSGVFGFIKISNAYSSGTINSQAYTNTSTPYPNGALSGGIFGNLAGSSHTITSVYYNSEGASSAFGNGGYPTGITGLTPAQLKQQANFRYWDFTNTWKITENYSTPTLKVLSDFEILPISAQEYTGTQIKPSVQVRLKNGGTVLTENVDYRVEYGTNQDVSTGGSVTVKRTGKFVMNTSDIAVFSISPKELTVSGATAQDKVYDGTTNAAITGAELVGVVEGDDVSFDNLTGNFESANAGNSILVYPNISLKGAKASNYRLTQPTAIRGNITPKPLTNEFVVEISEQTYSGSQIKPSVTVRDNWTTLSEIIDYTLDFGENLNVGEGTVTIKGKGNYSSEITGKTFTIIPKAISVIGATANKIYDGTTSATITNAALDGVVGNDDVLLGDLVGAFENANAGTNKSIIVNMSLSGEQAANYTLIQPTVTGNITAKELSVIGATASKVYDGTTSAAITNAALVGIINGDDVLLQNLTGTFEDANVGNDKTVSSNMYLYGGKSANYTLTQPIITGTITPKPLANEMITEISGQTYSGSQIKPSVIVRDNYRTLTENIDYTLDFGENLNAGNGTVSVIGTGNYSETASKTFTIIPKTISVIGATANKVYDGTTSATITGGTLDGVIGEDDVLLDNLTGTFDNANAGTNKLITVNLSLSGDKAANYTLTQPTVRGNITAKALVENAIQAIVSQTYSGSAITPAIVVKDGEKTLVENTDYTKSFSSNTNAGTASVFVLGKGNYSEMVSGSFTITPKPLANDMITPISAQKHTGEEITPFVIVKYGSRTLGLNTDYSVDYSNNISTGMASVVITGKGNYSGNAAAYFSIEEPKLLNELTILPIANQTYTGEEIKPAVTIKDGEKTLVLGTDYTVSYQNNNAVGTGIVSISGIGLYSGTEHISFEIIAGTTAIGNLNKPSNKPLFKSTIVSTQMEILLNDMHDIRFVVYDMTGNVVADGRGRTWDLRNRTGRFVANGSYLVVVEAKGMSGISYQYSAKLGVNR